jgi:hypothetical protein
MTKPFWDKKWGRDQRCAITYARLRPGKNKDGLSYCIELECGHRFYRKPLIKWILTNSPNHTCPVCRKPITKLL